MDKDVTIQIRVPSELRARAKARAARKRTTLSLMLRGALEDYVAKDVAEGQAPVKVAPTVAQLKAANEAARPVKVIGAPEVEPRFK